MIIAYYAWLQPAVIIIKSVLSVMVHVLFCFSSSYSPERVQQIQFNLFQFSDYVRDHFSTFQWNQTIVDDLQALYYEGDRDRSCQAFQVCASVDWCVTSLSFQDYSDVNDQYFCV